MADTDNPLKRLIDEHPVEFAAWLLDAEVAAAEVIKTELTSEGITADHASQVTLTDGHRLVLHLEFQGRSSDPPMPDRMLDYMVRLHRIYKLEVCSIVLYVGQGAGVSDTGEHRRPCSRGKTSIVWTYDVLRLWQMRAEDLLALNKPILAALVGQTRIDNPDTVLPEAVRQIETVPVEAQESSLPGILLGLIDNDEFSAIVEKMLMKKSDLFDTPFIRKVRTMGLEEGLEQGELNTLRRNILRVLNARFTLSEEEQQTVEAQLVAIGDLAQLDTLFTAALHVESFDAFKSQLAVNRNGEKDADEEK